jgi:poly(A) polymerase
MTAKELIDAKALDIDLAAKSEAQLYKWLLACLLLGKPIQQEIAAHAYRLLIDSGITSLGKLLKTDWDSLVRLLDQAHYVRYDFSTATKLLEVGAKIKNQYGSVTQLVASSRTTKELEERLIAFRGIGPVTAGLFIHEVAPFWFNTISPHDYESAKQAAKILNSNGYEAYIVGGAVRDLWLDRQPKDFDLVTSATPDQIMKIAQFSSAKYKDTAQAFGVTRVKFTHKAVSGELEIATFRKDIEAHLGRKSTKIAYADLEEDLMRRDFTINALALDPSTNQVIDYTGGIDDLQNRLVRFIGNPKDRINEDPLRIMRAIRFKNHLDFSYESGTEKATKQAVAGGFVEQIAIDRLRDELTNLLTHTSRRQALVDLDYFGILERVLPEVTIGKKTSQPPEFHAEGNVWQHELLILDYLPHSPGKRLAWAALLHDIGKPITATKPLRSSDRIRFNRHYAVGAEMAKTILRRLKFSTRDTKEISWMIYNHMAIDDLPVMRPSRQQRMLGHPAFEDLLELHRADAAASWRPGKRHTKPHFKDIERLWHAYQSKAPELRQPSLKRDLGIDGKWLLDQFGDKYDIGSGPVIGTVLSELDEWYRDEGVKDKKAYVAKVRQLLDKAKRHTKS